MDIVLFTAQVFGFVGLLSYAYSFKFNKKEQILKCLIFSNLFYGLQYLMLDAYSALFVCIIGMSRALIFRKYEQNKKDIPICVLLIIVFLLILSGSISYNGVLSLLPILIGISNSIGLWQKKLNKYRIICVCCASAWIVYNISVGAYVAIIASLIELLSSLNSIIKYDLKKKTKV